MAEEPEPLKRFKEGRAAVAALDGVRFQDLTTAQLKLLLGFLAACLGFLGPGGVLKLPPIPGLASPRPRKRKER